jgi:hypothetical protein
MFQNNYSFISKLIHKIALNNHFVADTSFDIEQMIYEKEVEKQQLEQVIFVTGLARSGTTSLFNAIYKTTEFASLTYQNMPFLMMPNIWKKIAPKTKEQTVERFHKDGLMVSINSPEAFDEYFWKLKLSDNYIKDFYLELNQIDESLLSEFDAYLKLVCLSYKKQKYLSKNNNNILRLKYLKKKFPSAQILLMFREPLQHANSLLKEHLYFSEKQKKDNFIVDYFNYLGHHEFGLNHKYFKLDTGVNYSFELDSINYWLAIWKSYYQYILENHLADVSLVCYETLCTKPQKIENYLKDYFKIEVALKNYIPPVYEPYNNPDKELLNECLEIYESLKNTINRHTT